MDTIDIRKMGIPVATVIAIIAFTMGAWFHMVGVMDAKVEQHNSRPHPGVVTEASMADLKRRFERMEQITVTKDDMRLIREEMSESRRLILEVRDRLARLEGK